MKRRTFLSTSAALGAAPLARPALAQGAGNPRVLRFVPHADLANPDPVWSTTTVAAMHGMMVWDTLYGLDESFLPQKQMVAGEEVSDDGLTWTLTLREGLMHHDGEKVRAADAVASIERAKRRQPLVVQQVDRHQLRPGGLQGGEGAAAACHRNGSVLVAVNDPEGDISKRCHTVRICSPADWSHRGE